MSATQTENLCKGGCTQMKNCDGKLMLFKNPSDGTSVADDICMPLTQCTVTEFESKRPLKEEGETYFVEDRECTRLTECKSNEFEFQAPTRFTDRICKPLKTCLEEEWYRREPRKDPTDTFYIEDKNCIPKNPCDGQYIKDNGNETTDRTCLPFHHFKCGKNQYKSTPPKKGCSKKITLVSDNYTLEKDDTHSCEMNSCETFLDKDGNCLEVDHPVTPLDTNSDGVPLIIINQLEDGSSNLKDCRKCKTQKYYTVYSECADLTECPGKWLKTEQKRDGSATSNNVCEDVSICQIREYEVSPPVLAVQLASPQEGHQ